MLVSKAFKNVPMLSCFPVGVILKKTGQRAKGYWVMIYGVIQMMMFILRGAWEAGQSYQRHQPKN